MVFQETLEFRTPGRGTTDITREIAALVKKANIETGLCQIFVHHTSASLILCENADPSVRTDLESFMARVVRDGDPMYVHDYEGDDDMAAHIRTILTNAGLNIPVTRGGMNLGTWQGIYLWEHRTSPFRRSVTVTILG